MAKTAEYLIDDYAATPIPVTPSVAGWESVPIADNGEDLIKLDDLGLHAVSFYAGLHDFSPYEPQPGAAAGVYLRSALAELLYDAEDKLPQDMALLVLDGYRPLKLQQSLYDAYYMQLSILQPTWTAQQLAHETRRYISLPSGDPTKPSPHNTGGATDHWIVKLPDGLSRRDLRTEQLLRVAYWLPAGASFDHGGEKAGLRYYEENDGIQSTVFQRNRRILFWLMCESGIEPYADEYWHYNYGNQMAAKSSGQQLASYGSVALSHQQQAEESQHTHKGVVIPIKKISTNLPMGEKISPLAA